MKDVFMKEPPMMRKQRKRYYLWYGVLAMIILIYGCGSASNEDNQSGSDIRQETVTYVTQPLALPEYDSFDAIWSDGTDLYYAAGTYGAAAGQYQAAMYALKQGTDEPEQLFLLAENLLIMDMAVDGDGNFYYLGTELLPTDGNSQEVNPKTWLYKLDAQGNPQLTLDLSDYEQGREAAVIRYLAVDDAGNIVLAALNQNIYVLDRDGNNLFETSVGGRVYDLCASKGKVFLGHDSSDGTTSVREIDFSGEKLSEALLSGFPGSQLFMAGNPQGELLMANRDSVYQYAPDRGETVKKFDWADYDLTGLTYGVLLPYGENGVLAVERDIAAMPMKVTATAWRAAGPEEAAEAAKAAEEKTVITLGVLWDWYDRKIGTEIATFNRTNPKVKLEVKYYNGDYARLYSEIVAGSGPELLLMTDEAEGSERFTEAGILEDLNPWLDGDPTLDRSDFLENVLTAFEESGTLYSVPVSVLVDTMVVKTSLLAGKTGWNVDEFIAFAESFPEGIGVFERETNMAVLRLLNQCSIGQSLNTEDKGNPLDRELLTKMLAFANRYQDDAQYADKTSLAMKIYDERLKLLTNRIYRAGAATKFSSVIGMGEPVTFVGYPVAERNGNLFYAEVVLGINANGKNKDLAWSFISMMLSKESQARVLTEGWNLRGFSARSDVLEAQLEQLQEIASYPDNNVYWISSSGNLDNGYSHRETRTVTDEEIDVMRTLIHSVNRRWSPPSAIDKIIEEEAMFYFGGDKPLEEVVDIIENRVRTYVSEMN